MTEMIERVARTCKGWRISKQKYRPNGDWEIFWKRRRVEGKFASAEDALERMSKLIAIAAIKAMRDPTDEMVEAGKGQTDFARDAWAVMVNEALGE